MRIYIESSVYGEYASEIDEATAKELFHRCKTGRYQLVTADLVELELRQGAPASVIKGFEDLLPYAEYVTLTQEALNLQAAYLAAGVIGKRRANDALHVALATVARCNILTSWDKKHIVKVNKITLFNRVNVQKGYTPINILFPEQVLFLA